MNGKFADSNILLYLFSDDSVKKDVAIDILKEHPVITMQVIEENMSVCIRKYKFKVEQARKHAYELMKNCDVKPTNMETFESALVLCGRYKYSFYDSLIIASALENKCSVLYSEDMQHKQVIEKKLRIVNPFV